MENLGILVGQLQAEPRRELNKAKTRNVAVFNFIDTEGNTFNDLKTYGHTADEMLTKASGGQIVSLYYSLSLRTSQTTPTGESVFALFVRNIGYRTPSTSSSLGINNLARLEGTLLENPTIKQEGGQQVAYITLSVTRRNIAYEIDTSNNGGPDKITLAIRNINDVHILAGCGKDSTISVTGKIKAIPGTYLCTLDVLCVEPFITKPIMDTQQMQYNQMGMQQQVQVNDPMQMQQSQAQTDAPIFDQNVLNNPMLSNMPNLGVQS